MERWHVNRTKHKTVAAARTLHTYDEEEHTRSFGLVAGTTSIHLVQHARRGGWNRNGTIHGINGTVVAKAPWTGAHRVRNPGRRVEGLLLPSGQVIADSHGEKTRKP